MTSPLLIITNCTARKRVGASASRPTLEPRGRSLEEAALRWRAALEAQPTSLTARDLYVGRSVSEAKAVSTALAASLHFVSAGLGLVGAHRRVPRYDLSAGSSGGLGNLLDRLGATSSDWWQALVGRGGIAALVKRHAGAIVLVALPADYLRMVAGDLKRLSAQDAARLRVFSSTAGAHTLADCPAVPVMPYDERLESIGGFAGTRADFPQRALRHFTAHLGAHKLDLSEATRAVAKAMSVSARPVTPTRRRLDDQSIRRLIQQGWDECNGNSARLLRFLRDDNLVACEQGRFADLRRSVARDRQQSQGR